MLAWNGPGKELFREALNVGALSFASGANSAAAAFVRYYGPEIARDFFSLELRDVPVTAAGTVLHSGASYSRNDAKTAQRIVRISSLRHLTRLELRNARLGDSSVVYLCLLTNLTLMDLAGNYEITDLGLGTLLRATASSAARKRPHSATEGNEDTLEEDDVSDRGFHKLAHLNLAGTSISDLSTNLISRLPALLSFDVSRTFVSYGDGIKPLLKGVQGWVVFDPSHALFPNSDAPVNVESRNFWMASANSTDKERGDGMVRKFAMDSIIDPTTDPGLSCILHETQSIGTDSELEAYVLGDAPVTHPKGRWIRGRLFPEERTDPVPRQRDSTIWVLGNNGVRRAARKADEDAPADPFERTFKPDYQPQWKEKLGRTPCSWRVARREVPIIEEVVVRSRGFGLYKAPEAKMDNKPKATGIPVTGLKDHTGKFDAAAKVVPVAKPLSSQATAKPSASQNPFAVGGQKGGFDVDELLQSAGKKENDQLKKANRRDWTKGWTK
jgi:hypothetical protein